MISLDELKREAAGSGVDVAVIEKDYVLSWILKGIYESGLAANLVFKGGTALRKVYFKDYRFSEDLDFTISKSIDLNDLKSSIVGVCNNISSQSGLELALVDIKQTRSINGEEAFEGKLQYIGPRQHRGNPSRIKLDLTAYEEIFLPTIVLPLIHGYSDQCQAKISAYRLEEILAEKLRTIIQRSFSRDLYDAWYILKFHRDKLDLKSVIITFHQKCDHKNIRQVDWPTFFQSPEILGKEAAFANSLGRQFKELPTFKELTAELTDMLKGVLGRLK